MTQPINACHRLAKGLPNEKAHTRSKKALGIFQRRWKADCTRESCGAPGDTANCDRFAFDAAVARQAQAKRVINACHCRPRCFDLPVFSPGFFTTWSRAVACAINSAAALVKHRLITACTLAAAQAEFLFSFEFMPLFLSPFNGSFNWSFGCISL